MERKPVPSFGDALGKDDIEGMDDREGMEDTGDVDEGRCGDITEGEDDAN